MAKCPQMRRMDFLIGEIVRRERRWTPAGATPARKLDRSTGWQSKRQGTASRRRLNFSSHLITETVARSLSTSRCSLVWVEQNA